MRNLELGLLDRYSRINFSLAPLAEAPSLFSYLIAVDITDAVVIAFAVAVLLLCLLLLRTLSLGGVALRCVISGENDGGWRGVTALFCANLEAYQCSCPYNTTDHF